MTIFQDALRDARQVIESLADFESQIEQAADAIRRSLLNGHKLLVCGNGGSAGDGGDFTTEFTCRFRADRRPFPALNLSDGPTLITAIANDYGYEEIFARQVKAFGQSGDVCIGISTSGNSENVKRALAEAKERTLVTIAMLGSDGGACRGLADIEFIVPSKVTARIQEAHKFLFHVLCETIEPDLQKAQR